MSAIIFSTILAAPAALTANSALAVNPALTASPELAGADPMIVNLIRIGGFTIMALGLIVIIARWWRNR